MATRKYFIVAHSGRAIRTGFTWGHSAALALATFATTYRHPAGLSTAAVYLSADAYGDGAEPLVEWQDGAIVRPKRKRPLEGMTV